MTTQYSRLKTIEIKKKKLKAIKKWTSSPRRQKSKGIKIKQKLKI